MLAIILAWIVISFVLLSFGDMLVSLYNKLCKQQEEYNIPDTFVLGMAFVLIPLSLSSLWLPSNHYVLFAYILASTIYWCCNKNRLSNHYRHLRDSFTGLCATQQLFFCISALAILVYAIWCSSFFDAAYYHYQNIRWNEEFAVVPGLGNLEDRFAFNSNYMLLSAIFTFRFVFGEPIYALQSILFVYVILWIIWEVIKSNFKISHIILLFISCLFFMLNAETLADSSTDIIPNICAFYFIIRFILYPESLKNKLLLAIVLPVCLATFKLSIFPLCFVSLFLIIGLLKKKSFSPVLFTVIASVSLITLWLVRNVIISGYLVYPMPEIDLFSFDWKMPQAVAELQRQYILTYAKGLLEDSVTFGFFFRSGNPMNFKMYLINNIIVVGLYIIIAVSPFVVGYKVLKKKEIERNILVVYITALLCFIYWYISAPDFRFATGVILGIVFTTLYIAMQGSRYTDKPFPKAGNIALIAFVSLLLIVSVNRSINYCKMLQPIATEGGKALTAVLYTPFSFKDQAKAKEVFTGFTPYPLGEITLYLTQDTYGRGFDKLPSTLDIGDSLVQKEGKIQSVKTIEARGNSLQDGFRTKPECIEQINSAAKEHQ